MLGDAIAHADGAIAGKGKGKGGKGRGGKLTPLQEALLQCPFESLHTSVDKLVQKVRQQLPAAAVTAITAGKDKGKEGGESGEIGGGGGGGDGGGGGGDGGGGGGA